jgi:formylglycine-generating enzyme required for sulfatase activity
MTQDSRIRPGTLGALLVWAGCAAVVLLPVSLARAQDGSTKTKAKSTKTAASKRDCPPPPPLADGPGPIAYRDCADTPEMIRLQGGRFTMGEQSTTGTLYERPLREVEVGEFSVGKYEVTFEEWDACVRDRGCLKTADDEGWGRGRRPVVNVSWVDAQQYVHWLSEKTGKKYRLLSEAEWEYAARAGTDTRFHWGDGAEWACSNANVLDLTGFSLHPNWHWRATCDDSFATTAPVGSFKPNAWGLHDTSGNVWEWVQDCWHADYTGAPTDSQPWVSGGECAKRVNRGGGWGNNPRSMRSASRDADAAEGFSDAIGFRVGRSP